MIFGNMPNMELTKLEVARYLYITLGGMVSFNTTFQNTTDDRFRKMYMEKVNAKNFNKIHVNCNMWAQIYSQLLTHAGIDNKIINIGHKYVIFYIDGEKWVADATSDVLYNDLSRIQNGDVTISFGPCFNQNIDSNLVKNSNEIQKLLDSIDYKLGYRKNTGELKNLKDLLVQIRSGNKDIHDLVNVLDYEDIDDVILKLEFLFSRVGKLSMGYYESSDFIFFLEQLLLSQDELSRVGATQLKRTNLDKSVDIIKCIYVKVKEGFKYYLLCPTLPVQAVTEEDIISLALLGYGIGEKGIPGVIYPKNFKRGKISSDINYLLYKISINKNKLIQNYDFCQSKISNRSK